MNLILESVVLQEHLVNSDAKILPNYQLPNPRRKNTNLNMEPHKLFSPLTNLMEVSNKLSYAVFNTRSMER